MRDFYSGVYKNKKILVTGHTGFKGSWLISILRELGAEVLGISLDPTTNSIYNEIALMENDYRLDICDRISINSLITELEFDLVFHLAAQPIVSTAYENPIQTFETNSLALANLILISSRNSSCKGFVAVTTDKVYKPSKSTLGHKESDELGGIDPYSASKSAGEVLITGLRSVIKRDDFKLVSVRAGNVIGGGDNSKDRLIPDLVNAYFNKEKLFVRNPNSVRPWIFVLDVLDGYLKVGEQILQGNETDNAYNFGPKPDQIFSVSEILKVCHKILNNLPEVSYVESQMIEDGFLFLNSDLAAQKLNWTQVLTTEKALEFTINWWKNYSKNLSVSTLIRDDIRNYYSFK